MRARLTIIAAVAAAAASLILAVELRGRAGRRMAGPAGAPPLRWRAVADAGAAYQAWRAAGVHGRRLVVFSGRWATVAQGKVVPPQFPAILATEPPDGPAVAPYVNADTALLVAAYDGTARDLTTVMPPSAVARRLEATRSAPGLRYRSGLISHPSQGYQRQIVACDLPPGEAPTFAEPVLVLVEPSYLGAGCAEVATWLAALGMTTDLPLVALADPAASQAQRAAARALAGQPAEPSPGPVPSSGNDRAGSGDGRAPNASPGAAGSRP